jgi:hypothetical protein
MEVQIKKPWDRAIRECIKEGHSQIRTYPEWMQMSKLKKQTEAIGIQPLDHKLRFRIYPKKKITIIEDGRNKRHTRFKIR